MPPDETAPPHPAPATPPESAGYIGLATPAAETPPTAAPAAATPPTETSSAATPSAETPAAEPVVAADDPHPDAAPGRTRRPAPLGLIAFVVAAVLAVAEGVAIYLGSVGQHVAATVLAQVLVVLTAVPLALGLYAVVRGRNRDWGIAAMIVALAANPLVLMNLLGFFGRL